MYFVGWCYWADKLLQDNFLMLPWTMNHDTVWILHCSTACFSCTWKFQTLPESDQGLLRLSIWCCWDSAEISQEGSPRIYLRIKCSLAIWLNLLAPVALHGGHALFSRKHGAAFPGAYMAYVPGHILCVPVTAIGQFDSGLTPRVSVEEVMRLGCSS